MERPMTAKSGSVFIQECRSALSVNCCTVWLKFLPDHNEWNLRIGCVSEPFHSKTEITRCSAAVFWSVHTELLDGNCCCTCLGGTTYKLAHQLLSLGVRLYCDWLEGIQTWGTSVNVFALLFILTNSFFPILAPAVMQWNKLVEGSVKPHLERKLQIDLPNSGARQACGACVIMWRWNIRTPGSHFMCCVCCSQLEAHFAWEGVTTLSFLCATSCCKKTELSFDLFYDENVSSMNHTIKFILHYYNWSNQFNLYTRDPHIELRSLQEHALNALCSNWYRCQDMRSDRESAPPLTSVTDYKL